MSENSWDSMLRVVRWGLENGKQTLIAKLSELADMANEIDRLKSAIREHRDQRADDRCWLDDQLLYNALGEGVTDPFAEGSVLPPKEDFLVSCEWFWAQRQCPKNKGTAQLPEGMTIAQLTEALKAERLLTQDLEAGNNRMGNKLDEANAEIERLKAELAEALRVRDALFREGGRMSPDERKEWWRKLDTDATRPKAIADICDRMEALERELASVRAAPTRPAAIVVVEHKAYLYEDRYSAVSRWRALDIKHYARFIDGNEIEWVPKEEDSGG